MDRRDFLKKIGAGAAALAMPKLTYGEEKSAKKPNLLFVMADQFRKQAMGFMNQDPVRTPNFDRFTGNALVCTNAISSCPICTPFRAMLMTGRYPLSSGMTANCQPGLDLELGENEICIGDILKANGYQTGYIGKWHLDMPSRNKMKDPPDDPSDPWDGWTPPGHRRHGFDFWYAYNCNNSHFNPNYWKDNPEKIEAQEWSVKHERNIAIEFIKNRQKDKPFALFVSWNPPHPPFIAPQRAISAYEGRKLPARPNVTLADEKFQESRLHYFAAVSSCDFNFGRLLAALDELGVADNTIVVFTADHGEMMGSHGRFGKHIWYEESIGIPFMIRWPGRIKPRREDMPFASYDFMPTLLGLMQLPIPEVVEGTDYSKVLLRKKMSKPTAAFIANYSNPGKVLAVGQEPSQWVSEGARLREMGIDWRTLEYRGLRTKQYTYVVDRYTEGPAGTPQNASDITKAISEGTITKRLLYDNKTDPYQLKPVEAIHAKENPIMAELDKELQQWLTKMNDPFPLS